MAPNPVGDELDVGGPAPAQRRNEYRKPVAAPPNDRPVRLHLFAGFGLATGNAHAVVEAVAPFVGRVIIANPRQVHLIAKARIKTDVIDATVLARLYASGFLPEVWVPDQSTLRLRRQVTRRNQIVRQRVRLKTMIQAILHAHLVPQ